MNLASVTICMLFLTWAGAVGAADSAGRFHAIAVRDCATVTADFEEARRNGGPPISEGRNGGLDVAIPVVHVVYYMAGWMSATNRGRAGVSDVYEGLSIRQAVAWLEKHCRDNPLSNVAAGLMALERESNAPKPAARP